MKLDRHIINRNGWFHYQRRVPVALRAFYSSSLIRLSLDTQDLEVARKRRDALEAADNEYWNKLKEKVRMEELGSKRNQPIEV